MNLKEIGEFGYIERFSHLFDPLLTTGTTGIGDDCAILPLNDKEDLLISTDLLIEDVHFLLEKIAPYQLGHKSVAVNLSDISAMGGKPIGTFLSIAIPPDMDIAYLDDFMQGYYDISNKYGTPLLGGDTTKSVKQLAINICVVGKCPKGTAKLRSMAKNGDIICVTGYLGDSAGGLQTLLKSVQQNTDVKYLEQKHHMPEPQVNEGVFLNQFDGIHAMMDISDGLTSDLKHILKKSHKSAIIHLEQLPISKALKNICSSQHWNDIEMAIGGGEDYELIFTVQNDVFEKLQEEFQHQFNKPVYPIGKITEGSSAIHWYQEGKEVSMHKEGFNHFT